MDLTSSKRLMCSMCLRPQSTCICSFVQTISSDIEVLILQHPLERHQAKGSATLLHLCLPNSQLICAETFSDEILLLSKYSVLLYPPTSTRHFSGKPIIQAASLEIERLNCLSSIRLVVIDGTWRKSRKILFSHPQLQAMPRLSLQQVPASMYAIRKAEKVDQLSTLEATCYALTQLSSPLLGEQTSQLKFQPLLHAMNGFVQMQLKMKSLG